MTVPSNIVGRKKEVEQLFKFFFDIRDGFVVPLVSVYGRSGSGKSTVVKMVCSSIGDMVSVRFVNMRKERTAFGCANQILYELGADEITNSQGLNKAIASIEQRIVEILDEEQKKFFVLVVDEYDVIFSNYRNDPSDFVQKLLTIEENLREKDLWLCMVAISNNSLLDCELDDRIKSRIGNSVVFFIHLHEKIF